MGNHHQLGGLPRCEVILPSLDRLFFKYHKHLGTLWYAWSQSAWNTPGDSLLFLFLTTRITLTFYSYLVCFYCPSCLGKHTVLSRAGKILQNLLYLTVCVWEQNKLGEDSYYLICIPVDHSVDSWKRHIRNPGKNPVSEAAGQPDKETWILGVWLHSCCPVCLTSSICKPLSPAVYCIQPVVGN